VACNAWQQAFIEKRYPEIEFIYIDGYNISYAAGQAPGKAANLKLVPRICKAIKQEQDWLQGNLANLNIDGIISDNRYGLYTAKIPCVIITHQLQVQTGMGKAANRLVQRMHYRFLEKFDSIWVPDVAGENNLAGELSHGPHLPANTKYIGWLSQFEKLKADASNEGYLLVLLSGPEPQRSILSGILLKQLEGYKGKVIFVAGSEAVPMPRANMPTNIVFHKTLASTPLEEAILGAGMVICRSGYSTLMDLVLLGKKAILIPTPGQTEQEYLARHLQEHGIYPYCAQVAFELNSALAIGQAFPYKHPALQARYHDYAPVIDGWLKTL
jgi:hypothetical protein